MAIFRCAVTRWALALGLAALAAAPGSAQRERQVTVRLASPIRHIGAGTKPMLLLHSEDDQAVPLQQALNMVSELARAGSPHRFVQWADKGHVGILPEVVEEARAFIAYVERGTLAMGDR